MLIFRVGVDIAGRRLLLAARRLLRDATCRVRYAVSAAAPAESPRLLHGMPTRTARRTATEWMHGMATRGRHKFLLHVTPSGSDVQLCL